MKKIAIITLFLITATINSTIAQPYVTGETTNKVFSEDFSDITKSFPITSSKDPKFWGTYGDGYYFMERKIERPRVVLANFKGTSKDFYLKTKVQLGPVKLKTSTVGVLFLTQLGGRGGFLLEINKKKQFRIKDIGNNVNLTTQGEDGWIKSKAIYGVKQNNKIEIKAFRGKFDIYFNNTYTYSFINTSYKKGSFGAYVGGLSKAKIIYYNVYELSIPNAPKEIVPEDLMAEIQVLKAENDSLKTQVLTNKYGGKKGTKAAISAIKILEDQVAASRKENLHLKNLITEYEAFEPSIDSKESEKESTETVNKITILTNERDSLKDRCSILEKQLAKATEVKESISETQKNDIKEPASPSKPVEKPSIAIPTPVQTKKESETDEKAKPVLVPLSEQKIPVKKAIKGEYKD